MESYFLACVQEVMPVNAFSFECIGIVKRTDLAFFEFVFKSL